MRDRPNNITFRCAVCDRRVYAPGTVSGPIVDTCMRCANCTPTIMAQLTRDEKNWRKS